MRAKPHNWIVEQLEQYGIKALEDARKGRCFVVVNEEVPEGAMQGVFASPVGWVKKYHPERTESDDGREITDQR